MNRKVSPTLIGAFVVGALALSVLAVVMFGSGRYFRRNYQFVAYFGSSVNGLRVGAPVKFRGVEVGSVKDIRLQLEPDMDVGSIPVIIEIDPEKLTSRGTTETILNNPQVRKAAIGRGLRAQLQVESFVTGVLFVALDYFPGSPETYVQQPGSRWHQYEEIPTQPAALERARGAVTEVLTKLAEVDFKALTDSVRAAVSGINQLVNSPHLKSAVQSLDELTHRLGVAAANVSGLATTLDGNVKTLSGDIQLTSAEARATMKHADEAIQQAEAKFQDDSPTFYELNRSLRELSATARSLRLLTSYLERNPRALIFGKPATKEE
jgi:paraquat-inducible protein B